MADGQRSGPVSLLPNRVQVGPYWYSVAYEETQGARENLGETVHPLRRIHIRRDCSLTEVPVTYLHEVLHCVIHVGSMKLREDDVERISVFLAQALQSAGILPTVAALADDAE